MVGAAVDVEEAGEWRVAVGGLSGKDGSVVLGVNKYSHDASVVIVGAESGRVLYACTKERITRRKHDGGGVAEVVRAGLETLGMDLDAVAAVAQGNHHRAVWLDERPRVLGMVAAASDQSVVDPHNLFPSVSGRHRAEVTHHLAHALGASATAGSGGSPDAPRTPFLCIVMDGMGERADRFRFTAGHRVMNKDEGEVMVEDCEGGCEGDRVPLVSDSGLSGWEHTVHEVCPRGRGRGQVPDAYREAESCYLVEDAAADEENAGRGIRLTPLFKRWCGGTRGDGEVGYGDWFLAPNDSIGAVYSDVAHRVFGDWNSCGKVMGLAPWAAPGSDGSSRWGGEAQRWSPMARKAVERLLTEGKGTRWILRGDVWPALTKGTTSAVPLSRGDVAAVLAIAAVGTVLEGDEEWPPSDLDMEGMGGLWDGFAPGDGPVRDAVRSCCAALAFTLQRETEEVALAFVDACQDDANVRLKASGALDVVLCGGVALNSVLNGRVEAQLVKAGRARTFVPPAPGDEGAALGCAVAALRALEEVSHDSRVGCFSIADASILPFAGPGYVANDIEVALHEYRDWLMPVVDALAIEDDMEWVSRAMVDGSIVFWYEGRGEWGPRALGHRSILVDPRDAWAVDRINSQVKFREDFRPLAPAILEEHAAEWFDTGVANDGRAACASRTMGKVWAFRDKELAGRGPACAHADLTARPQTIPAAHSGPLRRYRRVVEYFHAATGIPFVLNTSFNTRPREPPVETPADAIGAFLYAAVQGGASEVASTSSTAVEGSGVMVLCLGSRKIFQPAECPIDEVHGRLRPGLRPDSVRVERRHAAWELVRHEREDTLDESVELVVRNGMGDASDQVVHPLTDVLEAEIYALCDGSSSVKDLVDALCVNNEDYGFDEDADEVTESDVLFRLARLWRRTLVRMR